MGTLHLKVSQVLQGNFTPGRLNLLLAFQVNCPGCFIYALPLAARLQNLYGDRLQVLGLSTAFEDFALNTLENTKKLLAAGELVGATEQFFRQHGTSFSVPIDFPIAFDLLGTGRDIFTDRDVELVCQAKSDALRSVGLPSDGVKSRLAELLYDRPIAAYSFTINQLQGTPSWLLFDDRQTVLERWFGHKPEPEVIAVVDRALEALPDSKGSRAHDDRECSDGQSLRSHQRTPEPTDRYRPVQD